jgi:hypothetical protein
MTTLILVFIGLIVVGLVIQVLGRLAGDEGAEGLGGMLSGCGQMGCGCMIWMVILAGVLIFLLIAAGSQTPAK